MNVRSKLIKQIIKYVSGNPQFHWGPKSLVRIKAKSKMNYRCKSQSLQCSTEALQPPHTLSELQCDRDLAFNNKSKILQQLL